MFWPVVQSSVLLGGAAAGAMWAYYKIGPKRRYKARMRDMRSLHDLLVYHLEDLSDVSFGVLVLLRVLCTACSIGRAVGHARMLCRTWHCSVHTAVPLLQPAAPQLAPACAPLRPPTAAVLPTARRRSSTP